MGNENSKGSSTNERPSRLSRFKQKLHFRRPRNSGSTSLSHHKLFTADDFAGIAILTLIGVIINFYHFLTFLLYWRKFSYLLFFLNKLGWNEVQGQVAWMCFFWRADVSHWEIWKVERLHLKLLVSNFVFNFFTRFLLIFHFCLCSTDKPIWNSVSSL